MQARGRGNPGRGQELVWLARQQVVYEIASALIAPRVVPQGLYRRGVDLLGDAGLTDLTMLLGWFTGVSFTLMVYDVPANAVGLKR